MMTLLGFIALGAVAGVMSGVIGIGGGIVIIPALVFIFGLTQHQAQGITLAMLVPPIGIFAAWSYYRQGYVDLRIAGLLAIGFILGSFLGSRYGVALPERVISKVFGVFLFIVAIKMLLSK